MVWLYSADFGYHSTNYKFNTKIHKSTCFKQKMKKILHSAFVDFWCNDKLKHADGKLITYTTYK